MNKGQLTRFRSSKFLLESGLFSQHIVSGTSDFVNLMQQQNPNNKINLIRETFKIVICLKKKQEYKISQ